MTKQEAVKRLEEIGVRAAELKAGPVRDADEVLRVIRACRPCILALTPKGDGGSPRDAILSAYSTIAARKFAVACGIPDDMLDDVLGSNASLNTAGQLWGLLEAVYQWGYAEGCPEEEPTP
jgi:hypothetical protein